MQKIFSQAGWFSPFVFSFAVGILVIWTHIHKSLFISFFSNYLCLCRFFKSHWFRNENFWFALSIQGIESNIWCTEINVCISFMWFSIKQAIILTPIHHEVGLLEDLGNKKINNTVKILTILCTYFNWLQLRLKIHLNLSETCLPLIWLWEYSAHAVVIEWNFTPYFHILLLSCGHISVGTKERNKLPREAVAIPSMKQFKVRLDESLSSLI